MPSHLTRHVFRRLLANEPILHRGCLRRQQHNGIVRRPEDIRGQTHFTRSHDFRHVQGRAMFNLASMFSKKREPAGASMDPGLDKMMELEKMTRLKARLPPPEQIATALSVFFRIKRKPGERISDNQAQLAVQSLQYCRQCEAQRNPNGADIPWILTRKLLISATRALRALKRPIATSHVELGRLIYNLVRSRDRFDENLVERALLAYLRALSFSGAPQEALDAVHEYESDVPARIVAARDRIEETSTNEVEDNDEGVAILDTQQDLDVSELSDGVGSALASILQGFVWYGPHEKVLPILATIQERGVQPLNLSAIMQEFYLNQDDFPSALHWWQEQRRLVNDIFLSNTVRPNRKMKSQNDAALMTRQILAWCLRNSQIDSGHQIVQELADSNPSKVEWDAIFVWAAGMKKGVDEIDRMIGIMVQANEAISDRSQWRLPDIDTINALVESAVSRNDPYMAERFIALGRERDIEPNAQTYVLQMSYRLDVNDVDGALTAYKNLQEMDLSSNSDIPAVNRLIVALCTTGRHDFDTIMNVAADLSDRRARFEADTVATLSLLHLRRDERYDVIDLLNTHAYHFSSTERSSILTHILAFALDPDTPTARSWDAYTILRELFDEMPRSQRTELMTSFIRRDRPDMGVNIFQNMRMHSRLDTMPTIDTYVAAFMALAKSRELESLEVVHNQLKLDFNVQASTYLLNALIIAYTACGKPRHALDYWDEIAVSREGPSYNSVHVALRACEKAPFGDLKAQEIWSILRKRGVELDQSLWASYAAALVGNGDNGLAFRALGEAVERREVEVDEFVLGSLFAAGANREKQGEIEMWARERFPGVWEGLERSGWDTDLVGQRLFQGLDRSVTP